MKVSIYENKKEENERDFKIPYSSVKFVPFLLEWGLYNGKQQLGFHMGQFENFCL